VNQAQPATFASEWDACWRNEENQPWYPDEQVVRFLARYVSRRLGFERGAVRHAAGAPPAGLDLGCGKGRHVLLMSELGIRAYGLDVSDVAVAFARDWLAARGLTAQVQAGSMTRLPYEAGSMDFALCHGVLDHALAEVRSAANAEIERVLKPGGLYFVSVISERDSAFGKGRKVEADTWLVDDGFEAGIPQAFFDRARIDREFGRFKLESIVLCESETLQGRSLIGTDKHYQRDSRYYLTLRKA
jgi:SAM-dependent methyltransferase